MTGSFDFVHPWLPLLLLLLPPFFLLLQKGSGARGRRGRLNLVLRCLALALLLLALARPRLLDEVRRLAVAFVVDVSESIPVAERDQALRLIESDLEQLPEGDRAELIVFADRPSVEIPFEGLRAREGDAGVVARLDHLESRVTLTESDLAKAVEFAEGTFPEDFARRIVLVSDGNQTRGDLQSAARALKAAGVRLSVRPVAYRFDEEVLVDGLYAPERGRIGEPLQLRLVVSSQHATEAKLSLLEDGEEQGAPREVTLERGTNVFRLSPVPAAPGAHRYEVRVTAARDGNPANNVGRAGVLVGGAPSVLVAATSDQDERLAAVLEEAGIGVKLLRPKDLPEHPAGFVDADAVVLDNVPAYALGEKQMRALCDAVRELGVGLVVAGGDQAYGPGGYRGTPLEGLLPVDLETQNKKTLPKGALVVVLHSIEFDTGNTWAVRICTSALQGLSPTDDMGVVYYDFQKGETWLFPLAPVGDGSRQRALIDGVQVGDMPSFQNCFLLAEQSLDRCDAALKHVVVISDGDPQAPDPALVSRLVDMRVTISTICIGAHGPGSASTMQSLAARGGGRFRQLFPSRGDLDQLPALMLKEAATLRRASLVEKAFVPVVLLPDSPLLRGMGSAWPELEGYVVTSLRPQAETILLADEKENDPLLAAWHAGLGRVVAFTSDASSRWAGRWLPWERFGPFWAQIVRSTAPGVDTAAFPVQVRTDGRAVDLTLDARDAQGAPLTSLRIAGAALSEGQDPVRFEPTQQEAGRYAARFEVPGPGHYLLNLECRQGEDATRVLATAAVDYAAEYRSLQSHEEVLRAAAALTGGGVLPAEVSPFEHDFAAVRGRVEIWPHLLLCSLVVLLSEIFARRFDLRLDLRLSRAFALLARLRAAGRRRRESTAARARDAGIDVPERVEQAQPRPEPLKAAAAVQEPHAAAATLDALQKAKDRAARRRQWRGQDDRDSPRSDG